MSKQSPLESFDTELFINETALLQAIWDFLPEGDLAVRQTTSMTCENTLKNFLSSKTVHRIDPFLALYTTEDEPSTGDDVSFHKISPPSPLKLLGGGGVTVTASGSAARGNRCSVFSMHTAALLKTARGKGALLRRNTFPPLSPTPRCLQRSLHP
jgi:hypothetical protein